MDVKQVFERNSERLRALYAGQDQLPRYAALADDFRAHFGREPEMFVSAPGRTEVVGNHTDHQNGRVLAGAVNLDTVAAVAANGKDEVKLYSAGYDAPFVVDLTDLSVHESEKNTTFSLIRGVAARLKELGYAIGGFDAQVTSTVFKGSGLSSSAAFEVMLVAAFDALFNNWSIDPKLNARISQYAENVYFGKPSGLLDQSASA
ncbi:MAG: galactokinase family protein, partial [Clostridia bacterium]|nr:galactokinase family protein [Clostridia bacterium]